MTCRHQYVETVVKEILEAFDGGAWKMALEIWEREKFQGEELLYAWSFFPNPKHRGWLEQLDRKYVWEYLDERR